MQCSIIYCHKHLGSVMILIVSFSVSSFCHRIRVHFKVGPKMLFLITQVYKELYPNAQDLFHVSYLTQNLA